MADKEYVCAYNKCLHHGEKVKASEAVVIGKKHYHWDCIEIKQRIKECADTYIDYMDDKTQYPIALKIINTLVFKNKIPAEYILKNIVSSKRYYQSRPVYTLYGIRTLFWEREMKA